MAGSSALIRVGSVFIRSGKECVGVAGGNLHRHPLKSMSTRKWHNAAGRNVWNIRSSSNVLLDRTFWEKVKDQLTSLANCVFLEKQSVWDLPVPEYGFCFKQRTPLRLLSSATWRYWLYLRMSRAKRPYTVWIVNGCFKKSAKILTHHGVLIFDEHRHECLLRR